MTLLILVSFLYYQKTTHIIHGKISDLAEKNVSQTVGLFDLLLEGYDSVTKSLNSNYELLDLLENRDKQTEPIASNDMERSITNILGAVYFSRDDIIGIHVITNKGKIYNYERRFAGVADLSYSNADWYKKIKAADGAMVWLGLSNGSLINSLQKDEVFVFGRTLFDLTNYKPIGIVLIETDPAPIMDALSNVTISPNSRVYIVDEENRVIATSQKAGEQTPSFAGLTRPVKNETVVDNQNDQLIVSAKASVADWTVVGFTPKADMSAELDQTRLYLLAVMAAVIVLSTVLATLISRNFASPLKLLIREMKQVEMGNFRGSVNVNSFDEINSLVASFNRMVQRMDELIERTALASISEKNAQLQALQSQVNPHFLYNTLDMIYWMLDERENDRLGKVILALSHMFRYSSDWEEASKTTLRQELDQMRHYLTIIESRLHGRIEAQIEFDSKWLDVALPKMTLQPIIENAVKSGLEPLGTLGILKVYTYADEVANELQIVIADNGIGMDHSMLLQLRQYLADAEYGTRTAEPGAVKPSGPRQRKGIGLPNVHRRLVLMYGERYGLRINSKQGEGTTVIIVVPLPEKGEDSI
ncbi:sensor histidine kinase [Paenibacillus protaetiae]|uniref:Sensor histidine kinase n=2 Tax=Paenibacillus protaetiae TaxID=2509456 RepID=A0A4P6F359_9BACL|nr:sensor histidine kinase [Paenibacillus protaetiae]